MSEKLTLSSIWEVVKDLETKKSDSDKELGEIRATLVLNFGKNGRYIPDVIQGSESTINMMLKVILRLCENGKAVKG